jgi:2-hydroxychromene-2-carboxylate isomerase
MNQSDETARQAWHRAMRETQMSLASARDQAEAELRRRWELLRDAVDGALDVGFSFEDVARRLGLAPTVVAALVGDDRLDRGPLPA